MADWIEKMNQEIKRAESTDLVIVEEPRQQRMRDVSDWLNKTAPI